MLEKLNKKIVILFFGIFLISVSIVYALNCGEACYDSGVCCGGVLYQGCEDSTGSLYCPNANTLSGDLGDCLECVCSSPSSCEWQADSQNCQIDELC